MKKTQLYPLLFTSNLHTVVWGGRNLKPWKGLSADDEPVGESWEVSVVPSGMSMIANGPLAGRSLADVIAAHPEEVLGSELAHRCGGELPLLAKFIDAAGDLSIQVHPNDAMAQREHGKLGKSEMWYVISTAPGAALYSGFSKEITPEEYKQRVADGTITEVLARHEVHPGDVFYIPAGRVHAICGGILLAEIQQSSDVTYRIYDYNRPGIDGRPRELHTALAAQALDYRVADDYRTHYQVQADCANPVLDTPHFTVLLSEASHPLLRPLKHYGSFVIVMCVQGGCRLVAEGAGEEIHLSAGHSALIPACVADYEIIPEETGTPCRLLEALVKG